MVHSIAAAQDWSKRRLLQPLATVIKTVNGQAVHDEVKAFMLENEAVQTALVTRLLRVESRIRLLTALCAALVVAEALRWIVR